MARQYWLMKSEPYVYSIDDLERDGTTHWDGVRNYAARNLMRDKMRIGDRVLYYHSNAKPPGVAASPRSSRVLPRFSVDPSNKYHIQGHRGDRWHAIASSKITRQMVSLPQIRADPPGLPRWSW